MTDNEAWVLQVSPKLPDGTLVNIRGKDAFQFKDSLALVEELSGDIARVVVLLTGTTALASAGVTGQTTQQAFTPPQAAAVQQYQQSAAQPVQQQQYQQPAPQQRDAAGPVPVCQHGPMAFRSGSKNGRDWSAHFCPQPKGQPQCEAIWGA